MPVYAALAADRSVPWGRVWIAFGDERHVPPDDAMRNERAIRDTWLDRVPIPESQIVEWPYVDDADPADVALAYERRLVEAFGTGRDAPLFDLVLLGLGEDAHTAGLFPGTGVVDAPGLAVASRPSSQPTPRVSLTPAALSSATEVWFLVSGSGKSSALRSTLAATDPDSYPASIICGFETTRVYTNVDPFA